mmetsp:Transcript_16119/g.34883  ORF Transcript_16119/g.34883 Transcript_16119/m.34883 type:complete len:270 (+) Transcript_16119:652-1461(+)
MVSKLAKQVLTDVQGQAVRQAPVHQAEVGQGSCHHPQHVVLCHGHVLVAICQPELLQVDALHVHERFVVKRKDVVVLHMDELHHPSMHFIGQLLDVLPCLSLDQFVCHRHVRKLFLHCTVCTLLQLLLNLPHAVSSSLCPTFPALLHQHLHRLVRHKPWQLPTPLVCVYHLHILKREDMLATINVHRLAVLPVSNPTSPNDNCIVHDERGHELTHGVPHLLVALVHLLVKLHVIAVPCGKLLQYPGKSVQAFAELCISPLWWDSKRQSI